MNVLWKKSTLFIKEDFSASFRKSGFYFDSSPNNLDIKMKHNCCLILRVQQTDQFRNNKLSYNSNITFGKKQSIANYCVVCSDTTIKRIVRKNTFIVSKSLTYPQTASELIASRQNRQNCISWLVLAALRTYVCFEVCHLFGSSI